VEVARTEHILDNLSPSWQPITISIGRLVSSENKFGTFKVECWDWDENDTKHKLIGGSFLKLEDIKNSTEPMKFDLENPSVKKPGGICLDHVKFEVVPNFIDYLKSGLEINMISAIDFTGKCLLLFRFQWHSFFLEFPSLLE
jgi:hypothetical protein